MPLDLIRVDRRLNYLTGGIECVCHLAGDEMLTPGQAVFLRADGTITGNTDEGLSEIGGVMEIRRTRDVRRLTDMLGRVLDSAPGMLYVEAVVKLHGETALRDLNLRYRAPRATLPGQALPPPVVLPFIADEGGRYAPDLDRMGDDDDQDNEGPSDDPLENA